MHSSLVLKVHVNRDKVTWPGAIIKKTGEGMPNYDNNKVKGTLFITIDVKFPRGTFSDEIQEGERNTHTHTQTHTHTHTQHTHTHTHTHTNTQTHTNTHTHTPPTELIRLLEQESEQTVYNGL